MAWLDKIHHPEKYLFWFLKWTALSVGMGLIGGLLGTAFHYALHFVTHLRLAHPWLVLLLSTVLLRRNSSVHKQRREEV